MAERHALLRGNHRDMSQHKCRIRCARVSALALLLLGALPAQAAEYYVALAGSDAAEGSQAAPFATLQRAQTAAAPGDTVFIRGGTYVFTGSAEIGVLFD